MANLIPDTSFLESCKLVVCSHNKVGPLGMWPEATYPTIALISDGDCMQAESNTRCVTFSDCGPVAMSWILERRPKIRAWE
jgi:hypothetical protein